MSKPTEVIFDGFIFLKQRKVVTSSYICTKCPRIYNPFFLQPKSVQILFELSVSFSVLYKVCNPTVLLECSQVFKISFCSKNRNLCFSKIWSRPYILSLFSLDLSIDDNLRWFIFTNSLICKSGVPTSNC